MTGQIFGPPKPEWHIVTICTGFVVLDLNVKYHLRPFRKD